MGNKTSGDRKRGTKRKPRNGAGAPYRFRAFKNDTLIIERETLGNVELENGEIGMKFHKPEIGKLLSVSDGGKTLEIQIGGDILTIRHPDETDLR